MFGREAIKLITELDLSNDVKPFNEPAVRQALEEMDVLYKANCEDITSTSQSSESQGESSDAPFNYASIRFRHAALARNKRCILAYLYNRMRRLRQMRWEFGSILPSEVSANLLKPEAQWFITYNKALSTYMRSIGEDSGFNLTTDVTPPKSLYIEVRCLEDVGKMEFENGQVITFKKDTYHLLPRSLCEPLIKQGLLEHVNS